MQKQWFVLQALSGQENKARESMQRRIQLEEMSELVDEVLVPTEKVTETRNDRKATFDKKVFPGYVLAHLALYGDDGKLLDKTWYFVQNTPGIIGFIGGQRPVPLRPEEVDQILRQIDEKKDKVRPKIIFEPGDMVTITDGPFQNFSGKVEEVDPDHGKLKVSVVIFGRAAPVELDYGQVERSA